MLHRSNSKQVLQISQKLPRFTKCFNLYLRVEEDLSTATLLEMLKVSTVSSDLTGKNKGLTTNRKINIY